ncbi:hypothetical protein TNCV_5066831 [Trichonephila clavipes]|nr:hypothetical protein TNCV_5066831 [Trichonephila clavipes]
MCEIQRAEITLVKLVQQMEFNSEIKDLSCKGMVNPQSKIRNLSPFLDSKNVLRIEKFEALKRGLKSQQYLLTKVRTEQEAAPRIRFRVVLEIAKHGKPFVDGEMIKNA